MIDSLGPAGLALYRAALQSLRHGAPAAGPGTEAAASPALRTLQPRDAKLLIRHALSAFAAGNRAALLGLPAPRVAPVPAGEILAGSPGAHRDIDVALRLVSALSASLAELFPGRANARQLGAAAEFLMRRWIRVIVADAAPRAAGAAPDRPADAPLPPNPSQMVPVPVPLPMQRRRKARRPNPYDRDGDAESDVDDDELLRDLLAEMRRAFAPDAPSTADDPGGDETDVPLTLGEWLARQHGPLLYGPDGSGTG